MNIHFKPGFVFGVLGTVATGPIASLVIAAFVRGKKGS